MTVTLQFNVVKNKSWQLWSAGLSIGFCLQMDRWVSESVCMWKVKRWTKWTNIVFRSISLNRCSVGVKVRKALQGQLPSTIQTITQTNIPKGPLPVKTTVNCLISVYFTLKDDAKQSRFRLIQVPQWYSGTEKWENQFCTQYVHNSIAIW